MTELLDRFFPHRKIRNISVFYILSAVYNAWFMAGVWVFIWGAFISKTQIGLSDSITFAIGFLIELPSGVFADLIGRKKAVFIGNLLLAVGHFFLAFSNSFFSITSWYLVWTIGNAFQSGATEALAYDSLKQLKIESDWSKVISTSTIIGKTMSLICTAIGGMLFTVGFRLPYLTASLVGVVGIVASILLREIPFNLSKNPWSMSSYISQIRDGLSVLTKPSVRKFSLLCLTVSGVGYMYNWGVLRPLTAERFGFSPTNYAFLLSLLSLSSIIALTFLRKLQQKIEFKHLIYIVSFSYALIFLILGLPHQLIVGGLLMIGLAVGYLYNDILFSQFINQHAKAEHRATTLSAVALFTKLPYVLLAIVIGKLADSNALPKYTLLVGVISLSVWLYSYLSNRKSMTNL